MTADELSNIVIGLAIKVHRNLGPGLLESSYKECLFYEIAKEGLKVEKEKPLCSSWLSFSLFKEHSNKIITRI